MSASLRFLGIAVVGWIGLRAATLGMLPSAEAFTLGRKQASSPAATETAAPAIATTEFPPIAPPMGLEAATQAGQTGFPQFLVMPSGATVPIYYPAGAPPQVRYIPASLPAPRSSYVMPMAPMPTPSFYSPIPQLDEWPLSRMASAALPARRSAAAAAQQSIPPALAREQLDRLQLTAWALLRGQPGPSSLASGGTLGGSQAGARLNYNFTPDIAFSLRSSMPVGGARGGELAAGIRIKPLRVLPIALTAERRQAIGLGGGRSAFAMFLEGGIYQRPMPWRFSLDGYAQAGVVGIRYPALFADGGVMLTRPLLGSLSGGFGFWGGIQPGIYRVDAGPRLSMRVRNGVRVHLDWRQRLAGNAAPGSGPAVTLAGDF